MEYAERGVGMHTGIYWVPSVFSRRNVRVFYSYLTVCPDLRHMHARKLG